MVDINKLLKKKGWTGDEIGKALVLSLIDSYKQTSRGVSQPKELFSAEQFEKMLLSIKDANQAIRYNRYLGLQSWLMQYQAVANAYFQRLQGDVSSLLTTYSTARAAEDISKYIESLPAIMTQKQYDETREKRIEEQLSQGAGYNAFQMLHLAFTHFIVALRLEPKKPNPLKAIKKKYEAAPIVTERILSRYNKATGYGYYTLPDGRRSDQMTDEAWREAMTPPAMKEILGGDIDRESPPEIVSERVTNRAKLIFAGATEEEADKAQRETDERRGWSVHTEWHYYDSPPADLSKWDIIEEGGLASYYPVLEGDSTPEECLEQAKAFKEEFPELTETLLLEIDQQYFNGFKDIPVSKWAKTTRTLRELYELGYWGIRALTEDDANLFKGNDRAIHNGIAIMRGKSARIDERGYYIEPERRSRLFLGLERYTPENPNYLADVKALEDTRANIEGSLYWIRGYNKAIELIAECIGLPEFTIFKADIANSEARLKALNGLIAMLHKEIKDASYADKDAQQAKLQALEDFFQPFSDKEIPLPESAIQTARALLNDNLRAFEQQDGSFIQILTEREGEA